MPRDDSSPVPADDPLDPNTATPEQVGQAARSAILDALALLDRAGTPLPLLLAQQARTRPDKLLIAAARFAPHQIRADLGPTLQAMHLQALRALAAKPVTTIDQIPDKSREWLE
jgi:hypothetical protein